MKRTVAHEHFIEHGGGEEVAMELAATFDAPIFCGLDDYAPGWLETSSVLQGSYASIARRSTLARDLMYMWAWPDERRLDEYDTIIQSGNNPGWYVPREHQTVVRYLHSTPRNPYDLLHETDSAAVKAYSIAARVLYKPTVDWVDLFVCNSEVVRDRAVKYWGVDYDDTEVVYPPVDVHSFTYAEERDGFYLCLSRLAPTKRTDEIVEAFNGTDRQLVVAGDGPERGKLEDMAEDNIKFVGYVDEQKKRELMSKCKAFVFAASSEDFGIVPIEAMASGAPVICVNEGYPPNYILDGSTGILYDREAGLSPAIERFEEDGVRLDAGSIKRTVDGYSVVRFRRRMTEVVKSVEG